MSARPAAEAKPEERPKAPPGGAATASAGAPVPGAAKAEWRRPSASEASADARFVAVQTARIVSHPSATTLTLIGSGTSAGLVRPAPPGAAVTSFHISKAPAVGGASRSVVAAPIVAAGFAPTPIITTATLPATSRAVPRAAATTVTAGTAWLSQGRPPAPQARITTYPIGQTIRPVIPAAVATRPILATLAKQDLPTIRTLSQVDKTGKGAKATPIVGTVVGPSKEVTHVAVAAGAPLQSVVVGTAKGTVAGAKGRELKPGTVLQTLAPIAHLTGLKSAPRAPFVPAPQVKVLAAAPVVTPATTSDIHAVPTTVISSSLLIHSSLTAAVERTTAAAVTTLPTSYFYETGQPLTSGQTTSRLVMTSVSSAPTQVKLQAALVEEKPKMSTSGTESVPTTPVKMETDEMTDEPSLQNLSPTKLTPRPSILRKRDYEGSPSKCSKVVPFSGFGASSSPPASPVPKPDSDDGKENSSGGSSTISATSSPGLLDIENMNVKTEPDTAVDSFSNNGFGDPLSPRKKPRKQQLSGNELQEVVYPEEPKQAAMEGEPKKKSEGTPARVAGARRRSALLLPNYRSNAKLCHNHFRRPTDVRIREDRRPTVAELSSQKGVAQKAKGWKLYHLSTQMEVMSDREGEILNRFVNMLEEVDNHSDTNRTSELIRSNMQRSKVVRDQLDECRSQLLKLLDHGKPVLDIIKRNANRRQAKKKY